MTNFNKTPEQKPAQKPEQKPENTVPTASATEKPSEAYNAQKKENIENKDQPSKK